MCRELLKFFVIAMIIREIMTGKTERNCNCIPMNECSSVNSRSENLSESTKIVFLQFLKTIQCGFENGSPKICCPTSSTEVQHKPTPRPFCRFNSSCVVLKNCEPLVQLIKLSSKPLQKPTVLYLRSQECGFEENMPKVCCSPVPTDINKLSVEMKEDTTVMPSTRWTVPTIRRSTTTQRRFTTTKRRFTTVRRKSKKTFEEFRDEFFSDIMDFPGIF